MRWFSFALVAWLAALLAIFDPAVSSGRDETPKVQEGKAAPDFNLPATQIEKALPDKKDAKLISLGDLRGKNVVLYFYPKAMTPGCTRESCKFRDLSREFAELDTIVLGISTDKLDAQEKFTEKEKLSFPLLADADKKVTEAYGVLNSQRGMAQRATFVIDKTGIVRKVYSKADADKNPQEVLDWVRTHLGGKAKD
jgi:peroxiredoxin Q/BCP